MMSQQHLLVALAVIFMVMSVLGLTFTLWRSRNHQSSEEKVRSREHAHI
jgi:hypothetical protein